MTKVTRLDFLEGLKLAIQVEGDLRNYYEAASGLEGVSKNRELIDKLLKDETSHRRRLQKKYRDITGNKLLYLNVSRRKRLVELAERPDTTDSVLEQAIDNEQKAVQFYEEASSLVPPGWLRQIFSELAEEERKHLEMLKAEYHLADDSVPGNGRVSKTPEVHAA